MARAPRYARLQVFHYFLAPFQARARARRSSWFAEVMNLQPGTRIVDLGGSPMIWRFIDTPLEITLLNLEYNENAKAEADAIGQHSFHFLTGDACDVKMPSNSFDLAFSNSVIEHVGDERKRAAFAKEVRRLAPKYWVQTPAKSFPIEAHTGMPFWWYYPKGLRQSLKEKWRTRVPAWTEMIEGTDFVGRKELRKIFPEAEIASERSLGMVKSYIAYRA